MKIIKDFFWGLGHWKDKTEAIIRKFKTATGNKAFIQTLAELMRDIVLLVLTVMILLLSN